MKISYFIYFLTLGLLYSKKAPFEEFISKEPEFAGASFIATAFTIHDINTSIIYNYPSLLSKNTKKTIELELKHLSSTSSIRGESFIYASIINESTALSIRNMFSLRIDTPNQAETKVTGITLTKAEFGKLYRGVNLTYINVRGATTGAETKIYDGNGFSIDIDIIYKKGIFSFGANASNIGYIFFNDYDRITIEPIYRITSSITHKASIGLGKRFLRGKTQTLAGIAYKTPYINFMYGSIEEFRTYGIELKLKNFSIVYTYIDEPRKLFTTIKYEY
ncbi:MAG: hypothetical protein NZ870_01180 [bacterium]|nr:hypothetical protein [bacterium]